MRFGLALCAAVSALALTFSSGPSAAQRCGKQYTVKSGDTLSGIASKAYRDSNRWSIIYYSNQNTIGRDPSLILPGQEFSIPCTNSNTVALNVDNGAQEEKQPEQVPLGSDAVSLLTADDYRPFTDRALPEGGMITQIVNTALEIQRKQHHGPAFAVNWVNDWASHLNPLLAKKAFDMGFPWFRPNCEHYAELDDPAKFRCDTFYFSDPVFEILVTFFANKNSSFKFNSDADVIGKRLCRPSGYFTFDLDKDGRNWVKDEKVTLLRPQSVEECFKLLERGEIDAVAINEFTGRAAMAKSGSAENIRVLERPVSVLNLHVIVAKNHPRAKALLKNINQGLKQLRSSGGYGKIVERHLAAFWKDQG